MARSYRKTPIGPLTSAQSDKKFKQIENRRKRRRVIIELQKLDDEKDFLGPGEKEYGNPWAAPKDGKTTYTTEPELRTALDSAYQSLLNECYNRWNWRVSWHYLEELLKYAEIDIPLKDLTIEILESIPLETKEKFIRSYVKKGLGK